MIGPTTSAPAKPTANRILLVEDDAMIRLLLRDMLEDLGFVVASEAGTFDEALASSREPAFDIAILDVDLRGKSTAPVADILATRGLPFLFASGYGANRVPDAHRGVPMLQKPFQADALGRAIAAAAGRGGGVG